MNPRQNKFIEKYMALGGTPGSIKEAAEEAGYSYDYARKLVTKSHIVEAMEERQQDDPAIATREERQRFWSDVMRGVAVGVEGSKLTPDLNQRLKASELLGKTGGDFVERSEGELLIRVKRENPPDLPAFPQLEESTSRP